MDQPPRPARDALRVLAAVLLVLGAARLLVFCGFFVSMSLQRDFAGMYAAGESLAHGHGASPYRNNVLIDPKLWDGATTSPWGAFLYPPPMASFFRVWAVLPYGQSKAVWTAFLLGCVVTALALARKLVEPGLRRGDFWLLGGLSLVFFHPLLAALERGQIDAMNLVLTLAAVVLFCRGERRADALGGALLAPAILIKLHTVYLLPFLVLRRRPWALAGVAAGGVALLLVAAAAEGPSGVRTYWGDDFLKIAGLRPGLGGAGLAPEQLPPVGSKGGAIYSVSLLNFATNASAAQLLYRLAGGREAGRSVSLFSLAVYAALFAATVWRLGIRRLARPMSPLSEGLLFYVAMLLVMLAGPLTWTMNLVWLVPLGPLLWVAAREARGRREAVAAGVAGVGFVLAALPDTLSDPLVFPLRAPLMNQVYVLAELVLLAGLLPLLRHRLARDDTEPAAGVARGPALDELPDVRGAAPP